MATSAADKTVEVLSDIRDLLGEIRDRLPEPVTPSPGLAHMAVDDDPVPAAEDPDTEGDGDDVSHEAA